MTFPKKTVFSSAPVAIESYDDNDLNAIEVSPAVDVQKKRVNAAETNGHPTDNAELSPVRD